MRLYLKNIQNTAALLDIILRHTEARHLLVASIDVPLIDTLRKLFFSHQVLDVVKSFLIIVLTTIPVGQSLRVVKRVSSPDLIVSLKFEPRVSHQKLHCILLVL